MSAQLKAAAIALVVLLLCSCGPPASAPPSTGQATPMPTPSDQRRVLVAFGDSLTEGMGVDPQHAYPAQLERKLKAEGLAWKVENSGLSGETSSGARSRLQWVLKLKPDAVILEIGANDGLRGIDPKITRQNIAYLVTEFQKRDIPIMLAGMKTLSNLGPDYTAAFQAIYADVAKEKGVPLIPFFLEGVGGVRELNQEDRIHPTAEGYAKVVDEIAPIVIPWLKSLPSTSSAPSPLPLPQTGSTP